MAVAKQPLLDAVMLLEQFHCLYINSICNARPSLSTQTHTAFCYLKNQHLLFILGIQELPLLNQSEVLDTYGSNVILAILGGKKDLSFPNQSVYI